MTRAIAATLFFCLFAGAQAGAPAWAYDGKITYVKGEAEVVAGGASEKAQPGLAVPAGSLVRTSADSLVILTMTGGAELKINAGSSITVPEGGEQEISLARGSLFSHVPKLKPGARFRIRTPSAVMGVRGTEFFTAFGSEAEKDPDLWMCVREGAVEVSGADPAKSVLVRAGEGVLLPHGKEITAPKPYEWTKKLNWNMDPARGEVVDSTKIDYRKDLLKKDYD